MTLIRILLLTCLTCFVSLGAMAQKSAASNKSDLSADKLLSLGDFYFRSNDISDAADRYYKQAIYSAPGSQTAGYAQYNRGTYWFRKFYVVREKYSKEDRAALVEAEGQFFDFIDKFADQTGTVGLLADAEFYLALVYLQQGKREHAVGWLNQMAAEAVKRDKMVYVYKVVWSAKPGDIVDRNVDSAQLARYAAGLIQKGGDADAVVHDIKRWCQKQ